jgi:uncharacterized protein YodC (DUF2158 family)
MSTFKPGDVVRLKSGGPKMTVQERGTGSSTGLICVWFGANHDAKPNWYTFPEEMLEKAPAEEL